MSRLANLTAWAVLVLATVPLVGCRRMVAGTLTDVHLDYNRYRACTLRIERRDHLPAHTDHIRWFRWQHGADPGLPPCEEAMLRGPQHYRTGVER